MWLTRLSRPRWLQLVHSTHRTKPKVNIWTSENRLMFPINFILEDFLRNILLPILCALFFCCFLGRNYKCSDRNQFKWAGEIQGHNYRITTQCTRSGNRASIGTEQGTDDSIKIPCSSNIWYHDHTYGYIRTSFNSCYILFTIFYVISAMYSQIPCPI